MRMIRIKMTVRNITAKHLIATVVIMSDMATVTVLATMLVMITMDTINTTKEQ